jgi:predicted nucleic acid-binding protein
MSIYVVDASVAAKWFTEEEHAETALTLLDGNHQLHAPDFFMLEMDNIICKWIRRSIITAAEGDEVRSTLSQLPIQKHSFKTLQESAYLTANRTGSSVYDCLYVVLAALLKGRLVTADRQLYDGMTRGPFAKHLAWIVDIV